MLIQETHTHIMAFRNIFAFQLTEADNLLVTGLAQLMLTRETHTHTS